MLERVVTGGQSRSDRAGGRAAKAPGIATAGWMAPGSATEDGPRPEFAQIHGASEHPRPDDPRTRGAGDPAELSDVEPVPDRLGFDVRASPKSIHSPVWDGLLSSPTGHRRAGFFRSIRL
jgi:hypothetical protein